MPIIIDANRAGDFSSPRSQHAEDILALVAGKQMRVALGGRLTAELARTKLRGLLLEWSRSGRICRHADRDVDAKEEEFGKKRICSDDPHVLALAEICGCRLFYSNDGPLIEDFKNTRLLSPKGKVVTPKTKQEQARLLFQRLGG